MLEAFCMSCILKKIKHEHAGLTGAFILKGLQHKFTEIILLRKGGMQIYTVSL